jgi:hypothetical protein
MWYSPSPDMSPGRLRQLSETAVFSNGIHTDLYAAEGSNEGRIIHKPIEDHDVLNMFRVVSCWPPVWYTRPLLFPERVLPFGHHSELTILSESPSDGIVCGRDGTADRMTIDPERHYLLTHATGHNTELQITYKDDSTHGAIPHQWSVVSTSPSGAIERVISCEITKLEFNTPISADRFLLTFPVGTTVLDENDNIMEVNAAGKLVPSILIPRPADHSRLIWMLVTLVILGILVVVYMRFKEATG